MSCSDIFLGLIAVLFPPVAVWIKSGLCTADSLINILLCMLGYIPGLIHAWYIIAKYPEHDHDYQPIDAESGRRRQGQNGRVTYYYVNHEQQHQQSSPQGQRTYGTQQGRAAIAPKPQAPANKNKNSTTNNQTSNASNAAGSSRQPARPAQEEEQGAPPAYSEVVRGDNKIQSHD